MSDLPRGPTFQQDPRIHAADGECACGAISCPQCGMMGANGQPVVLLEIDGRTVEVDAEIAPIVAALNAAGLETVASCSGHRRRPGSIALRDGREIIIARNFAEARRIDALFPLDINGNDIGARLGRLEQAVFPGEFNA